MTKTFATLLAATAIGALASGCATKPKPAPAAPPPVAEAAPATELPPGAPPEAPAARTAQELLAAEAGDRVYFALDSDAVDAEARDILRRQAEWLRARPDVNARIEGNADERGTREYNLALGARRAAAARQALVAGGVPASRITTISFGKERPLDESSNEDAWARNRNAHTVVIGIAD